MIALYNIVTANPVGASLLIILGFALLIYGADWLVDGASAVAKRLGVSDLVIGLTIVAMGTSMPEMIVSLIAAIQHNTEIAITNVLGSNNINTLVILGATAMIYPIASQKSARQFDIPWSMLAGILVFFFAQDGSISGMGGAVLLIGFLIFMGHSLKMAKSAPDSNESIEITLSTRKAVLLILLGLVALVVGGKLIVDSATSIAHMMGVSDAIIGLTIVALGTSLPELATSCIAAYKHNCDLALGNVIGSNIFNVFFILGVSAIIHPLPAYSGLWLDAAMVALSSLLVMLFVYSTKKHEIKRWHGCVLVLVYAAYLIYRIVTL